LEKIKREKKNSIALNKAFVLTYQIIYTLVPMSIITTTLIAIALSMDAFAVSISSGIGMAKMRLRYALRMALFFGAFQAIMPLAGWSIGYYAADYIQRLDHWIAFILLTVIGAKMIYEACGRC